MNISDPTTYDVDYLVGQVACYHHDDTLGYLFSLVMLVAFAIYVFWQERK